MDLHRKSPILSTSPGWIARVNLHPHLFKRKIASKFPVVCFVRGVSGTSENGNRTACGVTRINEPCASQVAFQSPCWARRDERHARQAGFDPGCHGALQGQQTPRLRVPCTYRRSTRLEAAENRRAWKAERLNPVFLKEDAALKRSGGTIWPPSRPSTPNPALRAGRASTA